MDDISQGSGRRDFFYGWVVVAACFALGFLVGGIRFSLPLLLPGWVDEFSWTMAAGSMAIAITSFAQCGMGMLAGKIIDARGPKVMAVVGCLLIGTGLVLSRQASSLVQFYGLFAVLGIGLSAVYLIPSAIVNKWFVQRRGLVTGVVMAGGGVGTLVLPLIVGRFISVGGWQYAQLFLGILAFCFTVFAFLLKHYPEDMNLKPYGQSGEGDKAKSVGEESGFSWTLSQAVRTRAFWLVALIGLASGFGHYIPWTQLASYIGELKLPAMLAAYTLSVIGGCSAIGRVWGGRLGDKLGRKAVAGSCFALQGAAILYLSQAGTAEAFYLFAVVSGLSHGGMIVQFAPMLADFYGRHNLASIMGVFQAITGLGWALGSWAGGFIFDMAQSYHTAFFVGALSYVVAIVLLVFIKKPEAVQEGTQKRNNRGADICKL